MNALIDDKALYDREYFAGHYVNDPKRETMYLQEMGRILERYSDGGRILDIGCGTGGFLKNFKESRWLKYGIEPSEYARDHTRCHIVFRDCLEQYEDNYFRVVVFRGTLQHIALPMEALTQAQRVLAPGGLLVILATPDTESMVYQIWKTLPALDAPRNWIVFGGHFLMNILRRLDFENIEILHPYWGTPYASPLKDAVKFVLSLVFGYRKFAWPGNMMEIYAVKHE